MSGGFTQIGILLNNLPFRERPKFCSIPGIQSKNLDFSLNPLDSNCIAAQFKVFSLNQYLVSPS